MGSGGTWSVYWYNGVIVSSEISRGLDIFDLTPSSTVSQNEIDAAKTVQLEYLNTQGQPQYVWPPSFALARAYVDQLERSQGLSARRVVDVRKNLAAAEGLSGAARRDALTKLAGSFHTESVDGKDPQRIKKLEDALTALAK